MFLASAGSPIFCATAGVAKAGTASAVNANDRRFMFESVMIDLPSARAQLQLLQSRDRARVAGDLEDMHPGIGAVDDVDVAAVVGLHVVALDRDLAAILAVDLDAALHRRLGDRRDEVADLLRRVRIADVDGAHAGVEPGDEGELLTEHRRRALVRRMRAEAAAARAEVSRRLGNVEV